MRFGKFPDAPTRNRMFWIGFVVIGFGVIAFVLAGVECAP